MNFSLDKSFLAAGLVFGLSLPLWGSDYALGMGFTLCMWLALVLSWSILSANTGYMSLGHAVFCGVGAYVLVLTLPSLGVWGALLAAGLAAAVLAFVIGLPVMRVRGPYFVILTFGLAELVRAIVIQAETSMGQYSRLIFDAPPLPTLYTAMLALAVVAILLSSAVRNSRLGAGLIAIRENEEAAEAVGIPVGRLKVIALVLSAIVPGMLGGLLVLRSSYFDASLAFDPMLSFTTLTMVIVGGMRSARGPFLGAIAFVLLSEALWLRLPQLYMIVLGVLLITFILFVPKGLAGLFERRAKREAAPAAEVKNGTA